MKPKIADFYRLAIRFPSRLFVRKTKDNKYLIGVNVPGEGINAFYEFNPDGVSYVGETYEDSRF